VTAFQLAENKSQRGTIISVSLVYAYMHNAYVFLRYFLSMWYVCVWVFYNHL